MNYKTLEKPIIFFGSPRSGTSVISEIILRHRVLGFPSQYQNKFLKSRSINYLRRLYDNSLWRVFGQKNQLNKVSRMNPYIFSPSEAYKMWNSIVEEDINFNRGFLLNTKPSEESIKYIRRYFEDMVRKQGKKRLAFKITGPARMEYLSSIFPDAQFVRILRKPVPTVSSLLKVRFWQASSQNKLWWTGPYNAEECRWAEAHNADPVALAAFQIKKIVDTTEEEIERLNVDVLSVKYSDFVDTPEKVIEDILNHTDLSRDVACFNYLKKNTIYKQNKKDGDYFNEKDLKTIKDIFDHQEV